MHGSPAAFYTLTLYHIDYTSTPKQPINTSKQPINTSITFDAFKCLFAQTPSSPLDRCGAPYALVMVLVYVLVTTTFNLLITVVLSRGVEQEYGATPLYVNRLFRGV